jgi:hypothetical protein
MTSPRRHGFRVELADVLIPIIIAKNLAGQRANVIRYIHSSRYRVVKFQLEAIRRQDLDHRNPFHVSIPSRVGVVSGTKLVRKHSCDGG